MRVLCYAQHLSGVGHFIRMHALACGLSRRHEVHLVAGGREVPHAPDPPGLRLVSLPPLARSGGRLVALDDERPLESVLADRAAALADAVERIEPDAVLIDHYPFSKWEFEEEVVATIEAARRRRAKARIFCSLRDVVRQTRYENVQPDAYEERVLAALRSRFDGILVHCDARFTRIEEHFARATELSVPVAYTGFVVQPEVPGAASAQPPYAVLSCGGGSGALTFLLATIEAFRRLAGEGRRRSMPLVVFTGSFASTRDREALAAAAERSAVEIHPFGPEFVAALAGCALSVSRAGYNTCTALLRARTRAVLAPDPIMSDQRFRADRFAELGLARMVEGDPPPVNDLVTAIRAALDGPPPLHDFNLRGADGAEGCITSTKP